jgi:acyl-CoA thioesterase I
MLIDRLKAGARQHVVTYGTSLTEAGDWVNQIRTIFEARFPGQVTVTNGGKSAMWSGWGVENLDERVLRKNPDAVFIEFAINDAYLPYNTSPEMCRANLENMIGRIRDRRPDCQIILMTMNPPIREHLQIRPRIEEYYQVYRDVAAARGFLLIDHYPVWKAVLDADLAAFLACVPDGIHPAPLGCEKVIVPNILAALFPDAPASS